MTTKLLSKEEWLAVKPPLFYVKVKNNDWSAVHRELINKWIEAHCGDGWVFYDDYQTYVFQSDGDRTMFTIWIKSDPFEGDYGQII